MSCDKPVYHIFRGELNKVRDNSEELLIYDYDIFTPHPHIFSVHNHDYLCPCCAEELTELDLNVGTFYKYLEADTLEDNVKLFDPVETKIKMYVKLDDEYLSVTRVATAHKYLEENLDERAFTFVCPYCRTEEDYIDFYQQR